MKVSFILPAFKRRFLKEAIASILAQTYRDFELVVVDDCSPDELKAIVDGFSDPRVAYYRNETNLGGKDLVAAWEHAMTFATGEWCVLASDDDVYAPRFLEEMVRLIERHPQVDLVHSRVRIIDGDGRMCGLSPVKPEVESAIELQYARIVEGASQYAPEFMFRKARLDAIGGFVNFPKAWYSDDATWTLMAAKGCANCNEPLFSFRRSGLNISSSYAQVFDLVEAGVRYLSWAREHLASMSPSNDIEEFMLEETRKCLEGRVKRLVYSELDRTSLLERWRVLFRSSLPCGWRLRYLYRRLKSWI